MSRRGSSEQLMAARRAVDASLADLDEGAVVIVACSGGPDSLALVGATAWVGARRGLVVRTVVVDHGLQPGSDVIAARAVEVSLALGATAAERIVVEVGSAGGPESAARDARYAALADAAARHGASAVLLGHTRDDQAETVLLRLARGSGARSLSAMRRIADPWRRPFLDLSRAEVHAAAAELLRPLGAQPWLDPHNEDPAFARVRVRSLLADLVEVLGPGAVLGLARSADLLRDDADALDAQADDAFGRLVRQEPGGLSAGCDGLVAMPRAVRTRVVRLMALRCGCPPDQFGSDHVGSVEALVVDWHGQGALRLPGRVEARRRYGRLWLLSEPQA